jgi:hypothetical protein
MRHAGQRRCALVDEFEKLVARVRANGPVPLPLHGWDRASIWGWDETADSLFTDLWRNSDDPAKPPAIRIRPGELTPTIECAVTLAQHIAMAVDRDPWEVLAALDEADDQDEDWDGEEDDTEANEAGTVVTVTEGYNIWWPPNFGTR